MSRKGTAAFRRKDLPSDLGERITSAREKAERSRAELAASAGISTKTLARLARGEQRPTSATLRQIASAMRIGLEQLAPVWSDDEMEMATLPSVAPGLGVRIIRQGLGLSLAAVAEAAGVSVSTLSRFERCLHAPRALSAIGHVAHGAESGSTLVIASIELAKALGYESAAELTRACAGLDRPSDL